MSFNLNNKINMKLFDEIMDIVDEYQYRSKSSQSLAIVRYLEQQLKETQERLDEAEQEMKNAIMLCGGSLSFDSYFDKYKNVTNSTQE